MAVAANNAMQPRRMAEEESSRNTATLHITVSTSAVSILPQPPSPLVDEENEEQLSDARYKGKGKAPEISLTNTRTDRRKVVVPLSYMKIEILH
jgi:hypothetical protein